MSKTFRWMLVALVVIGAGTVPALAADAPVEPAAIETAATADARDLAAAEAMPDAVERQEEAPAMTLAPWPEPLFVQDRPVEQCGTRVCPPHLECCNPSCGICVEPGGFCIQIVCEQPNGGAGPN